MSNNLTQPGDKDALDVASQPAKTLEFPDPPKPRRGNVLLRSLGVEPGRLGFDHLGMDEKTRSALMDALARPPGLVLAVGPPGSGRTTTIFAAVEHIRASRTIMLTPEELGGELFVPEIRDLATAELAIQGARAGCLVVSTIRARNAAGAIRRLISLGMSPAFLARQVRAIVAQRLVRTVCDACREETAVRRALVDATLPRTEWRGAGCDRCAGSGYRGRTGIFELLVVDDAFRTEFAQYREAPSLPALRLTGPGLYEDGLRQVRAGVTTVEEVLRRTSVSLYPRL
ncbi:MAG TPA: ATPase, T2SS/T4P/T4SS family [Gemmatimonadaceae bacterium]|nr:ATPase, T2SS/T4P/T4SS family [Gemmatimonadaceae bacterium]